MKTSTVGALTLALAMGAYAQSLPSDLPALPTCAETPFINGLTADGCETTDLACHCKSTSFFSGIVSAVTAACSASDVETSWTIIEEVCDSVGVTIPVTLPAPGSDSGSESGSTTTSQPAETATTATPQPTTTSAPAQATTTSAPAPVSTTSAGSASGKITTTTTAPAAQGTSAKTTTTGVAVSSGNPSQAPAGSTVAVSASSTLPTKPATYTGSASKNDGVGMSALMGAVALGLAAAF
ncbi:hypothetical protein HRR83_009001 [Exophiala dermatitidis]|uniref:CFEM domain-containing protein n=2 Tax=Exophiala dermatitidis TaxID=5970 RepID=H6CC07_EXODN|nr:uncharacterized protein HMPREF1120_09238 [Exophiala dermatitidis NIH/UT8656]KAJ4502620.1 hypothetical protein HRR75_008348 [Exophiala dermatitidis]EHY61304.1 hypothetical protein HMPREF1120_09238 [Exophiala dermatitidis NIH/UT8656]KAJ4503462.1 hypothetical protein HRR73_009087 [Exophiala dermatitidis]KAJ4504064.1 hypothetical protein HRR74_009085 [Exophiala dermatitidis]KAJ4528947.1 hypothetical protein HRR76_009562 [Exophiala dermatitidis]